MFNNLVMFILFSSSLVNAEPSVKSEKLTIPDNFKVIRRSGSIKVTVPFICGLNEIFSDCVTPCQATCEHPNELPCPQFNSMNFPPKSLPVTMKARNYSEPTTTSVSVTTQAPNTKPTVSPLPGCQIGCLCAPGFVRNEFGQCFPRNMCPPVCKRHSHYERCGPRCQPTCEFAEPAGLSICVQDRYTCVSGCFCDIGYVKDMRIGECVRPDMCSQNCPENEHYSDFGVSCEPFCQTRVVDVHKCDPNHTKPLPGCYCDRGFIRDWITKRCVREADCPPEKCPENEEIFNGRNKCKPQCIPTCAQPLKCSESTALVRHKCQTGCDCKKGYFREQRSGKCVRLCDCPQFLVLQDK